MLILSSHLRNIITSIQCKFADKVAITQRNPSVVTENVIVEFCLEFQKELNKLEKEEDEIPF